MNANRYNFLSRNGDNHFLRLLSSLGAHELATLVGLLLFTAGLWVFAEIADEVVEGETFSIDRRILLSMRVPGDINDPIGPKWFEEFCRDVTALGGFGVLTLVSLATAGYLFLQRRKRTSVFVVFAIASGFLISIALKALFNRPRPEFAPHGSHVYTASFPSGHAMMSATVYLTLGALLARAHSRRTLKAYFLVLAVVISTSVALSRVYLGVHWPTDVLAGWTLGSCWAFLCWLTALWLQRHGKLESDSDTKARSLE